MNPSRTRSKTWRTAFRALAAALALSTAAACTPMLDQSGTGPSSGGGKAPTSAAEALAQLDRLTVAKAGSMRGYSRDRFPHWRDTGDNCDVRDTVLKRDGQDVKLDGCNVVGGRWRSVYDGKTITDPRKVDIDHMVPLANAWRSGADEWNDSRRGDFANDLTRPQLFAVSAASNRSKGDQDPSQWKPPSRDYWCTYAQNWITVKQYWHLSVTPDEKAALTDMLHAC